MLKYYALLHNTTFLLKALIYKTRWTKLYSYCLNQMEL